MIIRRVWASLGIRPESGSFNRLISRDHGSVHKPGRIAFKLLPAPPMGVRLSAGLGAPVFVNDDGINIVCSEKIKKRQSMIGSADKQDGPCVKFLKLSKPVALPLA